MLNSSHFLDGNKMLNDHVDKFKFSHKWPILFLELLSFLSHEFLDIIVLFVGYFEFVVEFGELFPSMLNFFLQRQVLTFDLIFFFHSFLQFLFFPSFFLFFFL